MERTLAGGAEHFCLSRVRADQALIAAQDPYVYFRWLGMLTGVAVAQLAAHLTGLYRSRLTTRYEALAQSERRTAESEAKLRKIFESTSDAIVIFSLVDGRTIEVNSEFTRVTGYTREEALTAPRGKLPVWGNKEHGRHLSSRAGNQRHSAQHGSPDTQSRRHTGAVSSLGLDRRA